MGQRYDLSSGLCLFDKALARYRWIGCDEIGDWLCRCDAVQHYSEFLPTYILTYRENCFIIPEALA